ncbi:MAG: hypothetical protein A2X25_08725 [Chloroflexi bacterium GWB2_49_20]|nr:MAG: hypothetical protein A2X25_08725 [Chloroflexi bacterium GWB2_49_20]OGN79483.1 MAG: hypothetical protein A2X26_05300 [Chloroflexi bacterium GWC2_49_37]OGN84594.1 MAG: hypothetical protein A2X27_11230 [Chloroflexi bacterium GWD2_49_16]HCC79296.1 hypothetical protein [Anaerolineae bacterium]HCM97218.1 hypothetical protein [Anaerolineae bacterium]
MSLETIEHTFSVSSPAQLKLGNISGSVEIQTGEDGVIHVLAVKQPGSGDAERTKIECLQAEDGSVSIATRFSDVGLTWLFGSQVCDVDYVIKVPRQCSLNVNGVSNSLHVSGFEGDLTFKTVSGDMTLNDLSGMLKIETVSGDITGEFLSGSGQLKSVSGDINLRDSSLTSASVNTVSGDVSLQTGLAEGPYKFHAVSGDVHLVVPGTSRCNVEMHSISGDFSTNFPVNQSSRSNGIQTSRLGGGGVLLSLNSVSGDLLVECDGEISQAPVKNSLDILSKIESGELTVEEALAQLNG